MAPAGRGARAYRSVVVLAGLEFKFPLKLRGMDFETIADISLLAISALGIGVPAWLVSYPPRMVRSWPWFLRLLLAVLGTHAVIYALFLFCIYPVARAYAEAHPTYALDGILLVPADQGWRIGAVFAPVFFAIRFCFLRYRRRPNHEAALPIPGNAD